MNKVILAVLLLFVCLTSGNRIRVFYNENNPGLNNIICKELTPERELRDCPLTTTNGTGDGQGLIGADRIVSLGGCLFAGNDVSQSVTSFKLRDTCADPTPDMTDLDIVRRVESFCFGQSVDEVCLGESKEDNCLFVGLGDIVQENGLYAYKADVDSCELQFVNNVTAPNWINNLPYRINGIAIDSTTATVSVAFTSGFGATGTINYDKSTCELIDQFDVVVDSTQPGLSTKTIIVDGNLINTVAATGTGEGVLETRDLGQSSIDTFALAAINDSVTASDSFTLDGRQFIYVGAPEGRIALVEIVNGTPDVANGRQVMDVSVGARITALDVSASMELVVSQSDGFVIFAIDEQGDLSFVAQHRINQETYGTATIFQFPDCCWNGNDSFNLVAPELVEADCNALEVEPSFTVDCDADVTVETSEVPSECSRFPDAIFDITATSCCGYIATATQRVTRSDSSPPIIIPVPNSAFNILCGATLAGSNTAFVEVQDDCSDVQELETQVVETAPGTCNKQTKTFPGGQLTLTATDPCQNSADETFPLFVKDFGLPLIDFRDNEDNLQFCADLDASPYNPCLWNNQDSCSSVACELTSTNQEDKCQAEVRVYTIEDDCGNAVEVTRTYERPELSNPFITLPVARYEVGSSCDPIVPQFSDYETHPCITSGEIELPPVDFGFRKCFRTMLYCKVITTDCSNYTTCSTFVTENIDVTIPPLENVLTILFQADADVQSINITVEDVSYPEPVDTCNNQSLDINAFFEEGGEINVVQLSLSAKVPFSNVFLRTLSIEFEFNESCFYKPSKFFVSSTLIQAPEPGIDNVFVPSAEMFRAELLRRLGANFQQKRVIERKVGPLLPDVNYADL